jgi:hypothetical protein
MDRPRLLRPLPLVIIVAFAAVAVVDFVQTLREVEPPPPVVLAPGAVQFEPWEPVIDLRSVSHESDVRLLPVPVLTGPLWSAADPSGVWLLGDGGEIEIDLARGGQRVIVFEGRPAAGKRPVRSVGVSVNGVDCGAADLHKGWRRWAVAVPPGTFRAGANRVVLQIPDRAPVRKPRRALQLRRIELRLAAVGDTDGRSSPPVTVDFETQRLTLQSPGVFEARFTVDDRVDALRMRYRFRSPGGLGEMTVARPQGGGAGRDAPVHRALVPSAEGVERIRVPLHGRRGEFVFRVVVEPWADRSTFDIRSVALVSEGNRSGRRDDPPSSSGRRGRAG